MPRYPEIANDLEKIAQEYPEHTDSSKREPVYIKGALVLRCVPCRPAIQALAARFSNGYTHRPAALERDWGISMRRESRKGLERRYANDPDLPQFLELR